MSEATLSQQRLAARLKSLRTGRSGGALTQRQVAEGLGASTALVSSWEGAVAVPPEDRLRSYALFFCTESSVVGRVVHAVRAEDLTPQEERRREELLEELVRLREEAMERPRDRPRETGALGGRFWYFPDGQPVVILCTPMSKRQLGIGEDVDATDPPVGQYAANRTHPNAVYQFSNGDIDALLELAGHIRAENPTIDVRWRTYDQIASADLLSSHVIILGGGADIGTLPSGNDEVVTYFTKQLELPVIGRLPKGGDEEFDLEFVVHLDDNGNPDLNGSKTEIHRPRFVRDETVEGRPRVTVRGAPQLEYDVGLVVRRPNPLNESAKVTICSGTFSRGTYGVVRTFTDANLRARNEKYLADELDPDNFWILVQVPVFAAEQTLTPDLGRASRRLRTS